MEENENERRITLNALEHYKRYLDKLISACPQPVWEQERADVDAIIVRRNRI